MLARPCLILMFMFAALIAADVPASAQVRGYVPGVQVLPKAMPMMSGGPLTLLMIYSFCRDNQNEDDAFACKRLAEADQKVTEASKKVAPDEPNDFERSVAASRKCGGAPRERGEAAADCETWRAAVEQRAKACAVLEARKTEAAAAAPPPPGDAAGSVLPVIKVGATEQVASLGQSLDLVGVVGTLKDVPQVRINGEPVELIETRSGDASAGPVSRSFKISVPTSQAGTNIYVIEACDGAGNCFGKDLVVRVLDQDGPATKGHNYALVIGNNDYKGGLPPLKTAVADATEVAKLLKTRYRFEDANVTLMVNPTREAILSMLSKLREALGPDDRLLIYYAGHGQVEKATSEGFWQPVDARPKDDFTWISNGELRRYLRGMSARHVLVVADSCFSGSLTRGAPGQPPASKDRFFAEIDGKFSRKVITSGGTEPVADAGSGGHSVFAYYFLKALRENNAPYLTSFELYNGFVRAVANNAEQKPEYGTIAMAGDEGAGDFTFALRN